MNFDTDSVITAVDRTVGEREVEGAPAKVVQMRRVYATTRADLWDALSNAERLPRWFAPVGGELELGGRFHVEGNASGTISMCEPESGFDATWEFAGATSWIEVRLESIDSEHTALHLAHIARPDDHWKQFGPGAVGIGWDLGLLGLYLHLETGASRPAEQTEWMYSDQAKQFMTESGMSWQAADIASGEDAEAASQRAQATIGFFTGASEQAPD